MLYRLIRALRRESDAQNLLNLPAWKKEILERVREFTMAGVPRTLSTIDAVTYVLEHGIKGDIVECGVWRGGQMMAAALTLKRFGEERDIHLFDTFEGMTLPSSQDKDHTGASAMSAYKQLQLRPKGDRWCEAGLEEVQRNMASTGYNADCIHLVQGDVEITIPDHAPNRIAYLRLDTDWYASTAHELQHLFPRVTRQGVVSIDDYGHWQGARQATDEYLHANGIVALLHRIDYSARQFVKV